MCRSGDIRRAHAVANGYFVGAINRVGVEAPWNIGEFYGSSYFCDPRGRIFAQASRNHDEVLTADLDLDMISEVRKTWQFFRDRRPEMYGKLVEQRQVTSDKQAKFESRRAKLAITKLIGQTLFACHLSLITRHCPKVLI